MRTNLVYAVGFVVAALPMLSTTAFSQEPAPVPEVSAAAQCPAGTFFEPSGYVASGKWRNAHCANIDGRQ
jgi:hypothetical protein